MGERKQGDEEEDFGTIGESGGDSFPDEVDFSAGLEEKLGWVGDGGGEENPGCDVEEDGIINGAGGGPSWFEIEIIPVSSASSNDFTAGLQKVKTASSSLTSSPLASISPPSSDSLSCLTSGSSVPGGT